VRRTQHSMYQHAWTHPGAGLELVASPFVVFERDEVSSVVGSLLHREASETATAGAKRPT